MRKLLLVLLVLAAKVSTAQYCGPTPAACHPDSSLTTYGMTDYHTFPCVHDSVPYAQVLQFYFPSIVQDFGQTVRVDSVSIDSIINLPCGLCWSAVDSYPTFPGGSRGCISISGTSN